MINKNSRRRLSFLIILSVVIIWHGWCSNTPTPLPVTTSYDANGLQELKVGDTNQLVNGIVRVSRVRMADSYRNPYEMADPYVKDDRNFTDASVETRATNFNANLNQLTQIFDWGQMNVNYTVSTGKADIRIEIQNKSKQVIEQVVFDLLTLKVPKGAKLWQGNNNLGAPIFSDIDPEVIKLQRAAFPDEYGDEEIKTLCNKCYTKAVDEHLMETGKAVKPLDKITEGTCVICKLQIHLPREPLVVAGTPQANKPISLQWDSRQPGSATLKVTIGNEQAPEVYDGVWNVRPIKPGAAEIIEVALRFGPAGLSAQAISPDLCDAFVKANPLRLHWRDRRPIAMAQLSAETDWGKGNPRGWWGLRGNGANIDTPEGKEIFNKWIMSYADQLITVADKAGSQGVIVWDLEGKQYPGCVYYGDPRIMKYTAPEMEAQADAFFNKLRDAGLRVGMCIRPTQIYPKAVPDAEIEQYRPHKFFAEMPYHETWDTFNIKSFGLEFWAYGELGLKTKTSLTDIKRSPIERLDEKIKYCKKRWGATLFYIDTNYFNRSREKRGLNAAGGYDTTHNWGPAIIKAADWEELCRRHPDVLLIPEHEYTQYWASTAPYRQPPHDGATPADVIALYPESFSAIAMNGDAETHIKKAVVTYTAAVQRGDLLMHHGWYGPSDVVPTIYRAAAETTQMKIILKNDGKIAMNDKEYKDTTELLKSLSIMIKGKPFTDRRISIEYGKNCDRKLRVDLVTALEKTDAIIVWSQPLKSVP